MRLFYACITGYDMHIEIAVCDSLELAKQFCQEHYKERKQWTRKVFNNRYQVSMGQEKVYFPQKLKWQIHELGYSYAEFPCEGTYCVSEIELNAALYEARDSND